ncbi:MAG: hypothetical protein KDK22_06065, partial [Rhodobacteraceae bacterium]|nr:hypothetical protein [Paracoccaceae bacterium]
ASMIFWGMAVGSIGAGVISDSIGRRREVLIAGAALSGTAYAAALFLPGLGAATLGLLLFLAGMFNGGQMLTFAMAKEGHPTAFAGTIIAFVNMIGIGGALVFQPLVGALLDASGGYGLPMLTIPGTVLAAALLAMTLTERRHPDHAA